MSSASERSQSAPSLAVLPAAAVEDRELALDEPSLELTVPIGFAGEHPAVYFGKRLGTSHGRASDEVYAGRSLDVVNQLLALRSAVATDWTGEASATIATEAAASTTTSPAKRFIHPRQAPSSAKSLAPANSQYPPWSP